VTGYPGWPPKPQFRPFGPQYWAFSGIPPTCQDRGCGKDADGLMTNCTECLKGKISRVPQHYTFMCQGHADMMLLDEMVNR